MKRVLGVVSMQAPMPTGIVVPLVALKRHCYAHLVSTSSRIPRHASYMSGYHLLKLGEEEKIQWTTQDATAKFHCSSLPSLLVVSDMLLYLEWKSAMILWASMERRR